MVTNYIIIKGLKDDEWWTLNFNDNQEIGSLNQNLAKRNNTLGVELDDLYASYELDLDAVEGGQNNFHLLYDHIAYKRQ